MRKIIFVVGIIMVISLLIACSPTEKAVPKVIPDTVADEEQTVPVMEEPNDNSNSDNTVKITASGFEPKTLTLKAGTTVTFVNEDSNKHWPASAMHPTHTVYPGSDIKKCGTDESIFDACKGLTQGESFSFTFNEKGSWKYHDHIGVSSTGTIVVE